MKLGIIKIMNIFILAFSIEIEATAGLDLLSTLMDPSQFYFDKRNNEARPVVRNFADITVLSRILGQSQSSH